MEALGDDAPHNMPGHPLKFTRRMRVAGLLLLLVLGGAVAFHFFRGPRLRQTGQWSAQSDEAGSVLFTPEGKTLVSGGKDAVQLWDPRTGALKLTLAAPGAKRLAVAPAGDILACARGQRASDPQVFELWDLKAATRIASFDSQTNAVAFSPAGPVIATIAGGDAATVRLWSLPGLAPLGQLPPFPPTVNGCAFSPDGKFIAVGQPGFVELFDVATLKSVRRFNGPATGHFFTIAFTPDGQTIAGAARIIGPPVSSGVWTWDVATARPKVQLDFGHNMLDCSFSADGKTLAVQLLWYVINRHARINVYDVERGRRACSLSVRRPLMRSIALSPDASQLAVGFQPLSHRVPATIGVWDLK
ncbi:MAG TPA: hypothetical protein VGR35_12705 [Tepidisphaeraceae bacterium]|nr:hypothetical protein [Tepidisphaeraceae bacterium]